MGRGETVSLKRVVITGRGAVSPFGLGVADLLDGVWNGRSGIQLMPDWQSIQGLQCHMAGPVPPFEAKPLLPRTIRRTMGPMAIYATLAAKEAVPDLSRTFWHQERWGRQSGPLPGAPEYTRHCTGSSYPKRVLNMCAPGCFLRSWGIAAQPMSALPSE